MGQSQINFDDEGIFHKLYESFHFILFSPILILVNRSVLDLSDCLRTVTFKKDFFDVLRQFGVVAEKTADKVVSEKLVKVDHLYQVYVQVQGSRGATSHPILLRLLDIILVVLEGETECQLICDVRSLFLLEEAL